MYQQHYDMFFSLLSAVCLLMLHFFLCFQDFFFAVAYYALSQYKVALQHYRLLVIVVLRRQCSGCKFNERVYAFVQ